jgi:F0F1-type ATP synthase gamma subunit
LIVEFYQKAEITQDEKKPNHLIIAMTSDRGLCGSVHSNIVRAIKAAIPAKPPGTDFKLIAIGDKARSILSRYTGSYSCLSYNLPVLCLCIEAVTVSVASQSIYYNH